MPELGIDREALAETLSRSRHPMRWEYASTSNIQPEDYAQADAVIAHLSAQRVEGEVEWAVQSRTFLDGPWDRIDDGRGWSHRDRPYTEPEARTEAGKRINGIDPATWRRVVTRTVGPWVEQEGAE